MKNLYQGEIIFWVILLTDIFMEYRYSMYNVIIDAPKTPNFMNLSRKITSATNKQNSCRYKTEMSLILAHFI